MEKITVTNNYQFCSFRRVKRIGSLLLFLSKQKKKKITRCYAKKKQQINTKFKNTACVNNQC